jgi:hypothetical protein
MFALEKVVMILEELRRADMVFEWDGRLAGQGFALHYSRLRLQVVDKLIYYREWWHCSIQSRWGTTRTIGG